MPPNPSIMYPAAFRWTIKNPLSLMTCGFWYFFGSLETLDWRRKRDSNPRYVAVYTLSRRAPSTARPSLLIRFALNHLSKARKTAKDSVNSLFLQFLYVNHYANISIVSRLAGGLLLAKFRCQNLRCASYYSFESQALTAKLFPIKLTCLEYANVFAPAWRHSRRNL